MDLDKGRLVEHDSRITVAKDFYKMTDPNWMYDNLKDDLALQMALYKQGKISHIDPATLGQLARCLHTTFDATVTPASVGQLLDTYAATTYLLGKGFGFAEKNHKKLMVIVFDPYQVTKSLIADGTRYDQPVVDYLRQNQFAYFDMNLVHVTDYKQFNLSVTDFC